MKFRLLTEANTHVGTLSYDAEGKPVFKDRWGKVIPFKEPDNSSEGSSTEDSANDKNKDSEAEGDNSNPSDKSNKPKPGTEPGDEGGDGPEGPVYLYNEKPVPKPKWVFVDRKTDKAYVLKDDVPPKEN